MSEIDNFTANVIISCIQNQGLTEDSFDRLRKLVDTNQGGPSQEAMDFFETNKGKNCKLKHTNYNGVIDSLNTSTSGFYPGSKYPIYVKITKSNDKKYDHVVGNVFEYNLDQIVV